MIELSATAGYALMAMGFLANSPDRWVLAREITLKTGITGPYLSRVLYTLVKAGLVMAKRGYRGGFCLTRPAEQVSIKEIVNAIERRSPKQRCLLGLPECADHTCCPVHNIWKTARAQLEASLNSLTLAEIAEVIAKRGSTAIQLSPEMAVGTSKAPNTCETSDPKATRRSRASGIDRIGHQQQCQKREDENDKRVAINPV